MCEVDALSSRFLPFPNSASPASPRAVSQVFWFLVALPCGDGRCLCRLHCGGLFGGFAPSLLRAATNDKATSHLGYVASSDADCSITFLFSEALFHLSSKHCYYSRSTRTCLRHYYYLVLSSLYYYYHYCYYYHYYYYDYYHYYHYWKLRAEIRPCEVSNPEKLPLVCTRHLELRR